MPVTAILVARNGAEQLPSTLDALARQSRRPDSLVLVDAGSRDASAALIAGAGATQLVSIDGGRSYGQAVARALHEAVPAGGAEDWIWLLAHDSEPHPHALAALLAAVEVAPSVAVAGPKVMRADDRDVISSYGETVTRFGATVQLVDDELDQAQHDRRSDVLAVGREGMLVRRAVFDQLGGFDPGLPSTDAALDLCIRVRLAGHRIVGVPGARVVRASRPVDWGRPVGPVAAARVARAAQLHRRLVYAPALALPAHWLSLLPLAVLRSIGLLLGKRPGEVAGEFAAALAALADGRILPARRNLARGKRLRWRAIAPFRVRSAEVRRLRSHQRAVAAGTSESAERLRPSFFSAGGAWVILLLTGIGAIVFARFLGAAALTGGGVEPLSDTVAELWDGVAVGYQRIGTGFVGASDPFALVLALLGTLSFWHPSAALVTVAVLAIPLAGLGAWWAAARLSARGWAPAAAAIGWGLAPPLLASLAGGHLAAVLAHLALPWLVLALAQTARSWSASATASLLVALVGACVPSLVPLLVVVWVLCLVTHPRAVHRFMVLPVPLAVLFAPLVVEQALRGRWIALLADPGVPAVSGDASPLELLIGAAGGGGNGVVRLATALGMPGIAGTAATALLLVPLAALAFAALVHPRGARAVPALLVALAGYLAALAASHLSVTVVGAGTATIWPGSALSVYWLGLLGAAVVALDALGERPAGERPA
ncbi:MAG: glycosyltransferase, partial [Microbacteriaceae bacterium]